MAGTKFFAPSLVHQMRYVKNKVLAMSTEQIAKEENVGVVSVQRSISQVEAYRALSTADETEISQTEIVLFNKDIEKLALRRALMAETVTEDGKRIPDFDRQLHASEILTDKAKNVMDANAKKVAAAATAAAAQGSGTNVNITNVNSSGSIGIATFEDRLREVKKKRSGELEQNTKTLPAEVIDEERLDREADLDEPGS